MTYALDHLLFPKCKYFIDEHLDPEYLEFLEFLAKPVENLPSAEIQLERREAERGGKSERSLIVRCFIFFFYGNGGIRMGEKADNIADRMRNHLKLCFAVSKDTGIIK